MSKLWGKKLSDKQGILENSRGVTFYHLILRRAGSLPARLEPRLQHTSVKPRLVVFCFPLCIGDKTNLVIPIAFAARLTLFAPYYEGHAQHGDRTSRRASQALKKRLPVCSRWFKHMASQERSSSTLQEPQPRFEENVTII